MGATFTPLYDWVMQHPDIESANEGLIVCRVLKWREGGCFESNSNIARALKMDPRTVQRIIKRLVLGERKWLIVIYPTKRKRHIWVDPDRMIPGPLWRSIGLAAVKNIMAYNLTASCRKQTAQCR